MNVQRTVSSDDPGGAPEVLLVDRAQLLTRTSWFTDSTWDRLEGDGRRSKGMNLDRFDLDARRVARP